MNNYTYDTTRLARRSLDTDGFRLPDGMGVGALRHQLAAATRNHWDEIVSGGAVDTVRENPRAFLGDAADTEDMLDNNDNMPLSDLGQMVLHGYMERAMHNRLQFEEGPPTVNSVEDLMADMLVEDLAGLVAQHVRDDIEEQTGHDPDSSTGSDALQAWSVI